MRILIVSWISATEEELMSLESALGPCWLQLTPSDWFPIDTDEAWEAVHIGNIHVSPAAQYWLTEMMGDTTHFCPTTYQVHCSSQQM